MEKADVLYLMNHNGNLRIAEIKRTTPKFWVTGERFETKFNRETCKEWGVGNSYHYEVVLTYEEYVERHNRQITMYTNKLNVSRRKWEKEIEILDSRIAENEAKKIGTPRFSKGDKVAATMDVGCRNGIIAEEPLKWSNGKFTYMVKVGRKEIEFAEFELKLRKDEEK